jgi:hypothetical protein
MGIFCLIMALPTPAISLAPEAFPALMAWGYTVGHIFTYIAFTYILRLLFSLVPRLANKDLLAVLLGTAANIFITVATFLTMVLGTRPNFNPDDQLIMYNTAPIAGVGIAVFAALAVFPTAILMIVNAFHTPSSRVRSLLLGGGLFITMAAGPMHDIARSPAFYATADVASVIGLLVIASGMLYRFDERAAWVKTDQHSGGPSRSGEHMTLMQ